MPLDLGEIGAKAGEIGGTAVKWLLIVGAGLVVLAIFGSIAWLAMKRKKWNLIVEVKIPRNNGKVILRERAKGFWDVKEGIVDIKRKKLKAVGMKPFDVKKYLQGAKYLEVIQISPKEYIPILPESYETLKTKEKIESEKGEIKEVDVVYSLMKLETDFEKRKTWKNYMERAAKNRFTLAGFLDKHWRAIEIGLIIFVVFLGFAIIWMRLPSICG